MDRALEQLVWSRAGHRCEYCLLPADLSSFSFQLNHVIAQKHGGPTDRANLALACFNCNSYKGPNIAGIDPEGGKLTRLFHPRRDRWGMHFAWDGPVLLGRTSVGRTTIEVLLINHPDSVELREDLIAAGRFPPGG